MQCTMTSVIILMAMLPYCVSYKDQYVRTGDTAIFRCPGAWERTSWIRGTETLKYEEDIIVTDKRFTFRDDDDEQLMALSDTEHADSNMYVCQLDTGEILVEYKLVVSEPPAIRVVNGSFSGPLMEVNETTNVSLWCNVTGNPAPTISWFAYFNHITPIEIGLFGPKLHIRNISRHCPWRYYCEMKFLKYEDSTLRKEMNLTINYSPDIVLQISKRSLTETDWHPMRFNETENRLPAIITDRIRLHCLIDTRPYISSTWLFNGVPFVTHVVGKVEEMVNNPPFLYDITNFRHLLDGMWEVLTVTLKFQSNKYYGLYECQTNNYLGNKTASILLYEP
ncbi:neurotrimin-like [Pecten maximus]|uniref:neurotrimin-like n=1 Tax=Pecten maximus TaxID=6579 RepID=UPI0014588157|nr:neurotrimin-like [Pecten maximus]